MLCPECRNKTEVVQTWEVSRGLERKRSRQCKNPDHRFTTVERVALNIDLDEVLVRHSGDGSLSDGPFDSEKLKRDVRRGVLNMLNEQQVHAVVEESIQRLKSTLEIQATTLTPDERAERAGHRYAMTDSHIRRAVELSLRLGGYRLAHVLYALSTLGRRDRRGRVGFETAEDVLTWIADDENYPRLAAEPVAYEVPPEVFWTLPPGPARRPDYVINRHQERRVYDHEQFVADIRRAMSGRQEAHTTSERMAKWVLWNLAGQSQVRTSQLAAGVTSALRRVDDIAYLRWVAVDKHVQTVRELVVEARALLETPSPRLHFVESIALT